jgi:uncharacterized protein YcnI
MKSRFAALLAMLLPSTAFAHAVVFPKASAGGAYERYVLRVPNEKDVATTRVEIHFPAELRVVSFADVPGWQLTEIRDSAKAIVGAVWTGNLPPERFVEFPFVAVNPESHATLTWPTYQTYASGERVDWIGPEKSEHPASSTSVGSIDTPLTRTAFHLSAIALALSLLGLGLALRKRA